MGTQEALMERGLGMNEFISRLSSSCSGCTAGEVVVHMTGDRPGNQVEWSGQVTVIG